MQFPSMSLRSSHPRSVARANSAASASGSLGGSVALMAGGMTVGMEQR